MTTKIKGAIEVEVFPVCCDGEPTGDYSIDWMPEELYDFAKSTLVPFKAITLTHTDLEAYVQERERKAFEAAKAKDFMPHHPRQSVEGIGIVLMDYKYRTFEDFKKENYE